MKKSRKLFLGIALVLAAGIYYYVALPAINIHSSDVWFFILALLVLGFLLLLPPLFVRLPGF